MVSWRNFHPKFVDLGSEVPIHKLVAGYMHELLARVGPRGIRCARVASGEPLCNYGVADRVDRPCAVAGGESLGPLMFLLLVGS